MGNYSWGAYSTLPTDDADLSNILDAAALSQIASDDTVRLAQPADGMISIIQFKDTITSGSATVRWNGQSNVAPSSSAVNLEIYNRTSTVSTPAWEPLTSDNVTSADTDFTLSAYISDLTVYKNVNDITCRVYQAASIVRTDDFNRADENPLSKGGIWIYPYSYPLQIVSQQVTTTDNGGTYNLALWSGETIPPDQYSQIQIVSFTAGLRLHVRTNLTTGVGPYLQAAPSFFYVYGGDSTLLINAQAFTHGTGGSGALGTGDTVKLTVEGTSPPVLKVYVNGLQEASVNDNGTVVYGNFGFALAATGTGQYLDNWEGGTL